MNNLSNHVVSKETAILLKEAGFPQESNYYWIEKIYGGAMHREPNHVFLQDFKAREYKNDVFEYKCYAALLATEILEVLPAGYFIYKIKLEDSGEIVWLISDKANKNELTKWWQRDKSLAEAAAQMYVYLSKHNLLSKE